MNLPVPERKGRFLPPVLALFLGISLVFPVFAEEEKGSEESPAVEEEGPPKLQVQVLGNFFFDFPGLDMSTLTPRQRDRFLKRINREYCTCPNCRRETVANCYINDPDCRYAPVEAKRILDEVRAGK